jgi:hypothetical protein
VIELPSAWREPEAAARIALIAESFERLLGRSLVPPGSDVLAALWEAPQAIVAHGTEADPIFFFGNRAALELFETTPEAFAAMPSRLSAEAPLRAEREALLARVAARGFAEGYGGMRISARGRRFFIRGAIIWNLVHADGRVDGQAATFAVPAARP